MLSILMLTAITAVALPHLRITTLSMVRSMAMAYALVAVGLVLSNPNGVIALFNDSVTLDTMGTYLVLALLVVQVMVLAYYTSDVIVSSLTPYTLVILLVIMLLGAYYLITTGDLLTLAVALELQSFSLYALTSLYRWREGATSAGLTYFMLGAFSSGLVLLGMSMIYAYTGETSLAQLTAYAELSGSDAFIKASLVVMMSGLFFKVTAAPFHYWGPEVYDRVPTVMTVLINVLPKFGLIALLVRLSPLSAAAHLTPYINLVVVLSWGFGSIVGLVQTRIKRLLAYSTVSHVGWMIAGIAAGSALGMGSFLFYVFQYSVTSVLTFLALIGLSYSGIIAVSGTHTLPKVGSGIGNRMGDVELISSLNGLYSRSAIFSVILATTLFSAAGIPPMVGFYAKLSVMQALLQSSDLLLVVIGVLSSIVSAGFYLSVISAMAFKPPIYRDTR